MNYVVFNPRIVGAEIRQSYAPAYISVSRILESVDCKPLYRQQLINIQTLHIAIIGNKLLCLVLCLVGQVSAAFNVVDNCVKNSLEGSSGEFKN